ncbi:vesicular-fusion protein S17 [Ceratocystis pirilliformis]|uniref:Vesicular-fusion protein S17 n=1 Tax=Ceratocystis pirilliformis TaxID=259994 RepID=A0ABR3YVB6_9PEZI
MSDPHVLLKKAKNAQDSAEKSFNFFGRRNEQYSNAADLFIQAGNTFRLQKLNVDAGKALEQAANIQEQNLKDPDDAANTRLDAFKAYRKDDPAAAARCVELAIRQYCSRGNFRRAAGHQEALAEIYDTELGNTKAALEAYEQAAGWYEGDNAPAMANKIWLKVAEMAALAEDYYKAVDIFERVARGAVDNNLMRYSVKDYLFKAGICHLASGDNVATQRALEKYVEIDPTFAGQREYHILVDLSESVRTSNAQQFTDRLFMFDQVSKLDKWKTTILVRVKNQIVEAPVDAEEDEFA